MDMSTPPPSDFTKPPPKRPPGVDWSDGLNFAMSDPEQILEQDDLTMTLKDAFPKARYHFLVVPRKQYINSVKELTREHLDLVKHIHTIAENLIARVQKKEPDTKFRCGYHAVPSLKRLHLHVVSQEFDSPRLKTKHHWNTFNTEYFIDSSKVIETLESAGHIDIDDEKYESLLTLRMKCNACNKRFRSEDISKFPESPMKKHLQEHYGPSRIPPGVLVSGRASKQRRHTVV